MSTVIIPPVISQPGVHSFESWRVLYKYILDCMYTNIEKALIASQPRWIDFVTASSSLNLTGTATTATAVAAAVNENAPAPAVASSPTSVVVAINVNWDELRRRLERHVYATSSSRFKSYHPIW